jgi:hypothetical protein
MKQRAVERLLTTRFRVITEVTHFGQSAGAHDTPSTLQILAYLTPAVLQELPQFSWSRDGHVVQISFVEPQCARHLAYRYAVVRINASLRWPLHDNATSVKRSWRFSSKTGARVDHAQDHHGGLADSSQNRHLADARSCDEQRPIVPTLRSPVYPAGRESAILLSRVRGRGSTVCTAAPAPSTAGSLDSRGRVGGQAGSPLSVDAG